MQYSRLRNLFGLLAVVVMVSGACSSPNGDPTAPALQNPTAGATTSAAKFESPGARFDGSVAAVTRLGSRSSCMTAPSSASMRLRSGSSQDPVSGRSRHSRTARTTWETGAGELARR